MRKLMSDIEIAQQASLKPIEEIAQKLGIPSSALEPYGHFKAKVSLEYLAQQTRNKPGHVVLVTAISPTPAGEGKTTTTVGLGDALNKIEKKTIICLREPALGPVFGLKGGAAGGGYAQIVPMEDINLHFTGDFHAVAAAHNLLAALVDNHLHHGNALRLDVQSIVWKRVVDMNDRALRHIVLGLGASNGLTREDGYDIVVASEVMAILCLAQSLDDLKERLGRIVVGYTLVDAQPVTASDLKAHGAMATLLKEAIKPNLVQTLENNPAFIHGGPFANIAHGCNSLIATQSAQRLADYVVTEAGFGADLGAEKFIDIKSRSLGVFPSVVVIVATIRALKFHGGINDDQLGLPDVEALKRGWANLERHINNVQNHYGLPCVVSLNHFTNDTQEEVSTLQHLVGDMGVPFVVSRHWSEGGAGAVELAKLVVALDQKQSQGGRYVYELEWPLLRKIEAVAQKIYGAKEVTLSVKAKKQLAKYSAEIQCLPICMAKTQMSFSTDPDLRGAPNDHVVYVREVRLAAGAGFVVILCGDMMTMPGLPKHPAAEKIDIDSHGVVSGLF
jgi:formate--tetrahydrofolate ligase